MKSCPHCSASFEPRRSDQVYCCTRCRMAANAARKGDGGLRGTVSRVSLLKGGDVSVVLRFAAIDRQHALQLVPGSLAEVGKA